jgi:hypothetical protein
MLIFFSKMCLFAHEYTFILDRFVSDIFGTKFIILLNKVEQKFQEKELMYEEPF